MQGPLTIIAHAGSAMDASLTITALEGAGFDVFVPGYHMLNNVPHLGVARGGVPIMVRQPHAKEAATFLAALPQPKSASESDSLGVWGVLGRVFAGLFFLFTGTAPSLRGVFRRDP